MARKPDTLGFAFGMALAVAVTVHAITTWAADPEDDAAAPLAPRQTIYRPQNWNLY